MYIYIYICRGALRGFWIWRGPMNGKPMVERRPPIFDRPCEIIPKYIQIYPNTWFELRFTGLYLIYLIYSDYSWSQLQGLLRPLISSAVSWLFREFIYDILPVSLCWRAPLAKRFPHLKLGQSGFITGKRGRSDHGKEWLWNRLQLYHAIPILATLGWPLEMCFCVFKMVWIAEGSALSSLTKIEHDRTSYSFSRSVESQDWDPKLNCVWKRICQIW